MPRLKTVRPRVLYGLYLFATVAILSELCLRFGLVPNENYRVKQSLERAKGAPSALILGDSFSLDADGSATRLLRQYFEAKGISSVNLSVGGYGPLTYLEKYRTYGRYYRPDVILLNYYTGNDISDTQWRDRSGRELWRIGIKARVRQSYLIAYLMDLRAWMTRRHRFARIPTEMSSMDSMLGGINPSLLELARAHPEYVVNNLLLERDEARRAWEANRTAIDQVAALARESGAKLLINVFPSTIQVSDSHFPFYARLGFHLDKRTLSEEKPQQLMREFCEKRGYECLDLLPAFRAASGKLYLEMDDHWNEAGNRLAFELIRARLERLIQ